MASEYQKILSPQAFQNISKKSAESLKTMLKGKNFMQASMDSMEFLQQLIVIEEPYRDELELIAEIVVKETYPIIKEMGILLDVKIVDPGAGGMNLNQSEKSPSLDDIAERTGVNKRRIINSITQGASIRGSKAFHFFKDLLDDLDSSLVERYAKLLDAAYGIYDDDNAIAMMLAMMSQNQGSQGGESSADWNEETGELTIIARAVCFPILVHEIVKGLYEIISMQGFSRDAEQNKQIAGMVDKAQNEPEDLRYGKFIYDALNSILAKYKPGEDIAQVREYFFAEIYKLSDREFIELIDALLADSLNSFQETKIKNIIRDL